MLEIKKFNRDIARVNTHLAILQAELKPINYLFFNLKLFNLFNHYIFYLTSIF